MINIIGNFIRGSVVGSVIVDLLGVLWDDGDQLLWDDGDNIDWDN